MSDLAAALAAFGAKDAQLVSARENEVYRVLHAGRPAALRLHRPGYQGLASIASELEWLAALRRMGMRVPEPLAGLGGDTIATLPSGRLATLVSWLDGRPLGEGGFPLEGSRELQERRFFAVSQEIARLHDATDSIALSPHFSRQRWDLDGFLGENPLWGRFWESPALTMGERDLIVRAREAARGDLVSFAPRADFGLIHADVLRENVLLDGTGAAALIDFDDAGWGFRIYDLAALMTQNLGEPHADALREAAIAGYRSIRSLPDDAVAHLDLFVMLRRFASMGWVVPRSDDPKLQRLYAERAVEAARAYLET